MRLATGICTTLLLSFSLAGTALAADEDDAPAKKSTKGKGAQTKGDQKEDKSERKGGLMEEDGKDPALTEEAEEGQFAPGKKAIDLHTEDEDGDGEPDSGGEDETGEGGAKSVTKGRKGTEGKDEPTQPKARPKPKKTIGVFGEVLFGLGKAPVPGPGEAATPDATSIGLLVGGHLDLTTDLRLMLRVPWTTASFDVRGQSRSANAFGAPEIAGRLRLTQPGDTEWAVRLGVGVPVAQGNPDPTNPGDPTGAEQAVVQRLADAASGLRDPELYAPKRLSIVPSLLLTHRTDALRFGAEAKLMFLQKVGGELNDASDDAGGTYEMSSLAASALLGGSVSYEAIKRGYVALAAWATYAFSEQVSYESSATKPTPLQLVLEPKLLAQFGRIVPSAGVLLPVGGELGGKIIGIRLHVDAVF